MARSSRNSAAAALAMALLVLAGASASAHRRDEYLQAARIAIEPDRVQIDLDLTPGIAVADSVLADVDRDRDGSISAAEEQAYVQRVARALSLDNDGRPLVVRLVGGGPAPSVDAIRAGEGTIRIQLEAALPRDGAGPHHLRFENAHRPEIGVYLANALVPLDDRVAVTDERRDPEQRTIDVAYTIARPTGASSVRGIPLFGACAIALASIAEAWRRRSVRWSA